MCKFHRDEFRRLGKKPWEAKYGEQAAHVEATCAILKCRPTKVSSGEIAFRGEKSSLEQISDWPMG
jgi:hypothetical protein